MTRFEKSLIHPSDHLLDGFFLTTCLAKGKPGPGLAGFISVATTRFVVSNYDIWTLLNYIQQFNRIFLGALACDWLQKKLIGGFNPSEKYESQLGRLFPTEWKNNPVMFQTTNQETCFLYVAEFSIPIHPFGKAGSRASQSKCTLGHPNPLVPWSKKGLFTLLIPSKSKQYEVTPW